MYLHTHAARTRCSRALCIAGVGFDLFRQVQAQDLALWRQVVVRVYSATWIRHEAYLDHDCDVGRVDIHIQKACIKVAWQRNGEHHIAFAVFVLQVELVAALIALAHFLGLHLRFQLLYLGHFLLFRGARPNSVHTSAPTHHGKTRHARPTHTHTHTWCSRS